MLRPTSTAPTPAPLRQPCVLVVDDALTDRLVMRSILQQAGFEVLQAASTRAARSLLREHDVDAVVSDVLLERETGFDLITGVRGDGVDIPVVLITSSDKLSFAAEAVRKRAFDYLLKPVEPRALVYSVREAVSSSSRSQPAAPRSPVGQGPNGAASFVFETLPGGLIAVDPRGDVLLVNREAERLLATDRKNLIDHPYGAIVHLPDLHAAIARGLDGDFTAEERTTEVTGHGRTTVVSYLTTPLAQPGESLHGGVVLHFTDSTHRVRIEHALIQADKLATLGLLAGALAHDINNPMTVLVGGFEMLAEELGEVPPEVTQRLHVMQRASWQCVEVVRNFLNFSRSNRKTQGPAQVREVLTDISQLVERELVARQIEVDWSGKASLPPVEMSSSQLQQVLLNLVVNARDAMPDGGRLSFRFRVENDATLVIEIQDTGSGIKPDALSRVFEPFFTTKPPEQGTGLGLAICRRMLRENGGELELASEPGRGTTATVRLPIARRGAPAAGGGPGGGREKAPLGLRVMAVDDEPDTLGFYSRVLARSGCSTDTYSNPLDALAASAPGRHDLALVDIRMPQMDGLHLCRKLREVDPELSVLLVSGTLLPEMEEITRGLDAVGFLGKPFRAEDLRPWLERTAELKSWLRGGSIPAALESQERPPARPYRVMIVDDDPDICRLLDIGLASTGIFEVETAGDGPSALARAASNPPDLILLDVMLPEMDGHETCRRLKEDPATSGIVVVMSSASKEFSDVSRAFHNGASQYLMKPTDIPDLVRELLALLEPPKRSRASE